MDIENKIRSKIIDLASKENIDAMLFLQKQGLERQPNKERYSENDFLNFLEDIIADPDGLELDYVNFHQGLLVKEVRSQEQKGEIEVTLINGQKFELTIKKVED